VTLAPNLTELVFAAGAGDVLVGISAYSDFPAAAAGLPVVSDAFTVDHERLALLQPDLVLAWESGTPRHVIDELRTLGYEVVALNTRGLDDIPAAIIEIGRLAGSSDAAGREASKFLAALQTLRERYAGRAPISVFYQISSRPLYTINRRHFIGEIISLCGGRNIFADLEDLAPSVDVEAVLDRNPEVLMSSAAAGDLPFADWQRWDGLAANIYGNHFALATSDLGRATPRLLAAAELACAAIETGRRNRTAQGA
jgi:iron complex transport system substrate-binding protein